MAEKVPSSSDASEISVLLNTVSHLLRHVQHLTPESQTLLADLLEELSKSLASSAVPASEAARLAECATHLVKVVNEEEHPGVLRAAQDRLERAALAVENEAPLVAGLARRLADLLTNLGI